MSNTELDNLDWANQGPNQDEGESRSDGSQQADENQGGSEDHELTVWTPSQVHVSHAFQLDEYSAKITA